jgi:hypothetical protein
LDLPTSFYIFWNFKLFLGILLNRNDKKNEIPALGRDFGPRTQCRGHNGPHASQPTDEARATCSVWPEAEGRPSRPVDTAQQAPRVATMHGTPMVARRRRSAGRQGAEAPVKVARAGELKGVGHSCGSRRSPCGRGDVGARERSRRGGASQRQGCSRELRRHRGWPCSSEWEMRR